MEGGISGEKLANVYVFFNQISICGCKCGEDDWDSESKQ